MAAWRRWGGAAWPRWDGCRRWGPWQTGRAALVERQGGALAGSGRRGRWRRGGGGGAQHGLDGTDAGDGVLGKREGHCYRPDEFAVDVDRSEEHTSELQSLRHLVCRLLLEKKTKECARPR